MEDLIAKFVAELLTKAGIDSLPEDFKKDYVAKLSAEVQQRLGIMALSELDEAGVKDFEALSNRPQTPSPQELLEFFNTRITDFDAKVNKALEQFSQEFLAGAAKLNNVKVSE